jgi:ribonucleotide reductase alpha subunit
VGEWEGKFYDAMSGLDLLPNSPCLMNAGTPLGQLSACFVLPVEDSMEDIFDALKLMALVQQSGGGGRVFLLQATAQRRPGRVHGRHGLRRRVVHAHL